MIKTPKCLLQIKIDTVGAIKHPERRRKKHFRYVIFNMMMRGY